MSYHPEHGKTHAQTAHQDRKSSRKKKRSTDVKRLRKKVRALEKECDNAADAYIALKKKMAGTHEANERLGQFAATLQGSVALLLDAIVDSESTSITEAAEAVCAKVGLEWPPPEGYSYLRALTEPQEEKPSAERAATA